MEVINLLSPGPAGVTAKLLTVLHDSSRFTNTLVLVAMLTMMLANMVTTI
jgi:hypothetical protein